MALAFRLAFWVIRLRSRRQSAPHVKFSRLVFLLSLCQNTLLHTPHVALKLT